MVPNQTKSTNFEFMISTGSTDPIIQKNDPLFFRDVVYDRTFGSLIENETNQNKVFIAQVDGLYRFELQVCDSQIDFHTVLVFFEKFWWFLLES